MMPLHDFRCVFMPYCLQRTKKGDPWEIVNREYLPPGEVGDHKHGKGPVRIRLTESQLAKISTGERREHQVWLYDDASVPTSSKRAMTEYLARVAVLMKAKIVAHKPQKD
jgi:hypothetical protein